MKVVIIGLLALGSVSSFASCDYRIDASEMSHGSSLRVDAIEIAREEFAAKGFTHSYGDNTTYILKVGAFWKKNTMTEWGYSTGKAKLLNANDGRTIFSAEFSDGHRAGYFLGIGKDSKALKRFKKAVKAMPNCEEL